MLIRFIQIDYDREIALITLMGNGDFQQTTVQILENMT